MFGNKNAGTHEILTRLNPPRWMSKRKKQTIDAVIPTTHRILDPFVLRETYFAGGLPIRWTQ